MSQSGSFIPQQQAAPKRAPRRRRVYIIGYAIYALFFGVLLTAGALFVWGWQLDAALAAEQQALNDERSSFNQSDMILVQEIDEKLSLIEYVLTQQPAVTRVLSALEETTVSTIQIDEFQISSGESSGGTITVTYTGLTDSFDAVLAQRDAMRGNTILSNAKILDTAYNAEESEFTLAGVVSYSVTLEIPLADVQYQGFQTPLEQSVPVVPQAPGATTTTQEVGEVQEFDETVNDPIL